MTQALEVAQSPLAVEVSGLCKRFPGVTALDEVSLEFAPGLITAVVGENGAGKSTLMTIMAGLQRPDAGTIAVRGQLVTSYTPDALLNEHGVALMPQEIALCPELSVAQNILLGREPGWLPSRAHMNTAAKELLERIDTPLDPRAPAGALSVAEQQLVLIVRALAREASVLILDEPTTSLTAQEVNRLFALLRRLRAQGTTVLYVSHRLPEVFEISDKIHVLRDGRHVASFETTEVDTGRLVAAMVGRELADKVHNPRVPGANMLVVDGLSGPGFHDVSFTVRAGEVVGVAGLPDSGRSEMVAALFGATRSTGTVEIDGGVASVRSPRDAMRAGIGYVPAERRSQALFPDMNVADNATILDIDTTSTYGLVRRRQLRRLASERLQEFDVRGSALGKITGLSGGNQQKVILGRWLAREPRVLLLDDPTRGVDVGAKAEIHDRLIEAAGNGAAVLMASSDLPELLRTCNRILVMARGRLVGVVDTDAATEELVMALATVAPDEADAVAAAGPIAEHVSQ